MLDNVMIIFYSVDKFNYKNPSSDVLSRVILLDFKEYDVKIRIWHVEENRTYSALNSKFNGVCRDDNEPYVNSQRTKMMYYAKFDKINKTFLLQTVHPGYISFYNIKRIERRKYDNI